MHKGGGGGVNLRCAHFVECHKRKRLREQCRRQVPLRERKWQQYARQEQLWEERNTGVSKLRWVWGAAGGRWCWGRGEVQEDIVGGEVVAVVETGDVVCVGVVYERRAVSDCPESAQYTQNL